MSTQKSPSEQLRDKLVSMEISEKIEHDTRSFDKNEFEKLAREAKETFIDENPRQPQSC